MEPDQGIMENEISVRIRIHRLPGNDFVQARSVCPRFSGQYRVWTGRSVRVAHGRFGLGVEVDLHNNWEIRVAYDRYDSTDDSFTNIIFFTVKKKL